MSNADLVWAMYNARPTNYVFGGSRYGMRDTDCSGMVDGAFYEVYGISPYSLGTWTGALWSSPMLDYVWSGTTPYLPYDSMQIGDVIFTSTTSPTFSTGEGSHVGFYTGDPSAPFVSHFANGGPYITAVNGVYGGREIYYGVQRYTPGSEDDMQPVDVWSYKNPSESDDVYKVLMDVRREVTNGLASWAYRNPSEKDDTYKVLMDMSKKLDKLQVGGASIDYDKLADAVADKLAARMKD